jgi:cell wall-associated NlpC family hydrolase
VNPRAAIGLLALLLAACGSLPPQRPAESAKAQAQAREVVLVALALLETGYRFGGRNPEAGLDCSGMVSHVYAQATGIALRGSAADIARQGHEVAREAVRPGDLVFFNTRGFDFSHVGIYLGDGRFVHAPASQGKVRVERLDGGWFASRWHASRRLLD